MTVKSNHSGKKSGKTTYLHSAKAFPFRTIVAATDFSEESSAALRCAQAIARRQHAMLLLIHVIDPVGYAFPEGAPAQVGRDAAARVELARIEAEVRQHGIPVHSRVETGLVCERILLSLRDHKAALLVLGTKAITGAGRAALGAVTRQLLAQSPCPILTVAPKNLVSSANMATGTTCSLLQIFPLPRSALCITHNASRSGS